METAPRQSWPQVWQAGRRSSLQICVLGLSHSYFSVTCPSLLHGCLARGAHPRSEDLIGTLCSCDVSEDGRLGLTFSEEVSCISWPPKPCLKPRKSQGIRRGWELAWCSPNLRMFVSFDVFFPLQETQKHIWITVVFMTLPIGPCLVLFFSLSFKHVHDLIGTFKPPCYHNGRACDNDGYLLAWLPSALWVSLPSLPRTTITQTPTAVIFWLSFIHILGPYCFLSKCSPFPASLTCYKFPATSL